MIITRTEKKENKEQIKWQKVTKATQNILKEEYFSIEFCGFILTSMKENEIIQDVNLFRTQEEINQNKNCISEESLDYHKNSREKLIQCLKINPRLTIQSISDFLITAPYQHSVLFKPVGKLKNFDYFEKLSNNDKFLHSFNSDIQSIKPRIVTDSTNTTVTFQFNLLKEGFLRRAENNEIEIFYTVLIILDFKNNLIEFRFNRVPTYINYRNNSAYFYMSLINLLKERIIKIINQEIQPLELAPVVKYLMEQIDQDNPHKLVVTGQAIKFAAGDQATLEAGNSDEPSLPLIGDLKNILSKYEDLLMDPKNANLYNELNDVLYQAEVTSEHPWITLNWQHNSIKVKFSFNYNNQGYDLLYIYKSSSFKEGMTYVRQMLCKEIKELNESFE